MVLVATLLGGPHLRPRHLGGKGDRRVEVTPVDMEHDGADIGDRRELVAALGVTDEQRPREGVPLEQPVLHLRPDEVDGGQRLHVGGQVRRAGTPRWCRGHGTANRRASSALISTWRSRKARSSRRLRRSQPVTSSLHLLALQELQAGAMLSRV